MAPQNFICRSVLIHKLDAGGEKWWPNRGSSITQSVTRQLWYVMCVDGHVCAFMWLHAHMCSCVYAQELYYVFMCDHIGACMFSCDHMFLHGICLCLHVYALGMCVLCKCVLLCVRWDWNTSFRGPRDPCSVPCQFCLFGFLSMPAKSPPPLPIEIILEILPLE